LKRGWAWLLLCTLLAGCVSSPVTTTSSSNGTAQRSMVEPGDADRRAKVRLELASLYFGRGQNTTALEEVNKAMAARNDLPEAYTLRGLIHGAMGDLALADQDFLRALQLAPRDGDTRHNYGWFLCQQQRFEDADRQFTDALAQPQYRDTVRTLLAQGVCQARAGRWADAERTLSRSYQLDPTNPVTAYNLSDVLLRRGELERARFYIGRINTQPDLTSAQSLWLALRIERRLGNLQGMRDAGRKLQERFPEAPEVLLFEQGRFDE